MDQVNSWKWVVEKCELDEIDPFEFMSVMKVKNVGFVGDSLNENLVGARPVLLSQTRTTLNVREDKGGSPERTDRRDLTYPNRTIAA
ncbi:trichome birefringence-like protein 12 [Tanacetum coccineum]